MDERKHVLKIRGLDVSFKTSAGMVNAVRGVDLDLFEGETLAIVGESGSGKSVTVKTVMGIRASNETVNAGSVEFTYRDGEKEVTEDLVKLSAKEMRRRIKGKRIAMVFQDPMTSLDPTMTIGKQIMEGMCYHYKTPKAEAYKRAVELLEEVGIEDAEKRMKNYPHQLSGGMRQRVVIAIALACRPQLLICDEPTTALDVTVQAKILELIQDIQKRTGIAVIYITHDLGVVANLADRVAVMYAGKIVETGTAEDIFYRPKHPYTQALLKSLPTVETSREEKLVSIAGTPPDLFMPPKGCEFASRCEHCMKVCKKHVPPTYEVGAGHKAVCWRLHPACPAQSKEGN